PAKDDNGRLAAIKGFALWIAARDVAENRSVGPRLAVEQNRYVRDTNGGCRGHQIDKRIIVHEVMEELAIFHQARLRNIEGLRTALLTFRGGRGDSESSKEISAFHWA